jgi:hypothetical protein
MASNRTSNDLPVAILEFDNDELVFEDAHSAPPPYIYDPLPPLQGYLGWETPALKGGTSHFRLLTIYPGQVVEPLRCKLTTYDIEGKDVPKYQALSYTWGESKYDNLVVEGARLSWDDEARKKCRIRHPLWVGESRILISTNLRDALRRFRTTSEELIIWVDALCINQDDITERATQVVLMPRIYHHAQPVRFWLGEEDDESRDAIEILAKLNTEFERCRNYGKMAEEISNPEAFERLGLPQPSSPRWDSIKDLYSRPVFQRMWIVQEIVLSGKLVVHCGSLSFDLFDYGTGIEYLLRSGWKELQERFEWTEKEYRMRQIVILKGEMLLKPSNLQEALVRTTRQFQATVPHDKIFAILGMMNNHCHRSVVDLYYGGDTFGDRMQRAGFGVTRSDDGTHVQMSISFAQKSADGMTFGDWVEQFPPGALPTNLRPLVKGRNAIEMEIEDQRRLPSQPNATLDLESTTVEIIDDISTVTQSITRASTGLTERVVGADQEPNADQDSNTNITAINSREKTTNNSNEILEGTNPLSMRPSTPARDTFKAAEYQGDAKDKTKDKLHLPQPKVLESFALDTPDTTGFVNDISDLDDRLAFSLEIAERAVTILKANEKASKLFELLGSFFFMAFVILADIVLQQSDIPRPDWLSSAFSEYYRGREHWIIGDLMAELEKAVECYDELKTELPYESLKRFVDYYSPQLSTEPVLANSDHFYREGRSYVRDLVDCYVAKKKLDFVHLKLAYVECQQLHEVYSGPPGFRRKENPDGHPHGNSSTAMEASDHEEYTDEGQLGELSDSSPDSSPEIIPSRTQSPSPPPPLHEWAHSARPQALSSESRPSPYPPLQPAPPPHSWNQTMPPPPPPGAQSGPPPLLRDT